MPYRQLPPTTVAPPACRTQSYIKPLEKFSRVLVREIARYAFLYSDARSGAWEQGSHSARKSDRWLRLYDCLGKLGPIRAAVVRIRRPLARLPLRKPGSMETATFHGRYAHYSGRNI